MKSKGRDREIAAVSGEVSVREARKRLVVSIHPVATPDAAARHRRAIDLLLQAAERDAPQSDENQTSHLAQHRK